MLLQIEDLLAANGYGDPEEFLCEWDVEPERWILELDIYLHPPKSRKCVDICYEKTSPGFVQSFQFFVCDFFLMPEGGGSERMGTVHGTDKQTSLRICGDYSMCSGQNRAC